MKIKLTKKLNICLLTSSRISSIAYGGEKRFTTSLGDWMAKQGQQVTLIGSRFPHIETRHLDKLEINDSTNIETRTKGQKSITSKYPHFLYVISRLWISLLWFLKVLRVNNKSPLTIIHAQDSGYAGLASILSGKFLGIPVIISSHGIRHKTLEPVLQGKFKSIYLKFERNLDIFTIKNADRVLVSNPAIKRYIERIIVSKTVDFIPMPIRLRDYEYSDTNRHSLRNELGLAENMKLVGFVGRFSAEKNLFTLLSAFANLAQKNPLIKLTLVGSGTLDKQLREYVIERGLEDKVIFLGVRHDIGRILASFDIFVLPSYSEGVSNALLEAMSSGRAIICGDIEANREIVRHTEEALLVNPYNEKELEDAIRLLCSDHTIGIKLGENAKNKSREYDQEIVFPRILRYYQTLEGMRRKKTKL